PRPLALAVVLRVAEGQLHRNRLLGSLIDCGRSRWIVQSFLNAGQWLRFDHVPITRRSRFIAEVRVHPEWPRDRATEVEFRIFASAEGRPPLQAVFVPRLDKQTEWTRIELDLAPLAGHDAGIQLKPSANQEVWTLMRDPKIVIVEDRAPH
ncbi:hypothetical protein J7371_10490, partial [Xanthomonas phaseoli pv. dieffenbachiae]